MSRAAASPVALVIAALLMHLVLILPNHPAAMTPAALLLFPLELPVILLGLLVLPARSRASDAVRLLLVGFLALMTLVKALDYAMFTALGRAFNVISDISLIHAGWQLATGAIGTVSVIAAIVATTFLFLALIAGLWWATGRWVRVKLPAPWRFAAGAAMFVATSIATAQIGQAMGQWRLPVASPGSAFTTRVAMERVDLYRQTLADLARFHAATRTDPLTGRHDLFDRLEGRDIELVYIESYGRASVDNALYAPTHVPTLRDAETDLRRAGLEMRSAWLTSPISGGQSWLAHATVASGLKIDNQRRYAALLASERRTLFHLARQAGYHVAAVMPAITMPWPEAELLGLQTVLAARDMGYRGDPFNWVTMPDQFTLARYEQLLAEAPRPRLTQIALISSHAPWVPIPEMVGWDEVGDGTIFNRWANEGDPPEIVWRNRDRVRDQYRLAVDYSLQAIFSHAARRGQDSPLMIVLGDHQAAGFVSQMESFDVPIHFIGSPRTMRLIDGWNWSDGLVPNAASPVWAMELFRDRFVRAFSSDGTMPGEDGGET